MGFKQNLLCIHKAKSLIGGSIWSQLPALGNYLCRYVVMFKFTHTCYCNIITIKWTPALCVLSTDYNVGGPVGSIPVKATKPVDVPKKSYHDQVDETTPCMYNIATIQICM